MTNTDSALEQLVVKYPRLFRGRPPAIASWVPPGWSAVVDELLGGIDALLTDGQADAVAVEQIKEKYGTLRFYFAINGRGDVDVDLLGSDGVTRLVVEARIDEQKFPMDAVRALVAAAADKSMLVCQTCGGAGRQRNVGGWVVTLCDVHAAERAQGRAEEPR